MEDCEARRDCSVTRRDDILSEKKGRPTYNKLAILNHTHRLFTLVRIICSYCCVLSAIFSSNKTKIHYNNKVDSTYRDCRVARWFSPNYY